jgi:hypothetical protein
MDKVICGPIVRRVTENSAFIWLILQGEFNSEELNAEALAGKEKVSNGSSFDQLELSETLNVIMLRINCNNGWPDSEAISYDIFYKTNSLFNKGFKYFDGLMPVYPGYVLPFFKYMSKHESILSASCRKPHGADVPKGNNDALAAFDKRIEQSINPSKLPSLLFLTGDQIYADDVEPSFAEFIANESKKLFPQEAIPQVQGINSLNNIDYDGRDEILSNENGFYSDSKDCHLIGFREFFLMYIAVWGGLNVTLISPKLDIREEHKLREGNQRKYSLYKKKLRNHQKVVGFLRQSQRVRRLMAHISTYMMFDDHEVTDDWNLNEKISIDLKRDGGIGQIVVTNALASFAIFQAWGNDPEDLNARIFDSIAPYLKEISSYSPTSTSTTFKTLNKSFTFIVPSNPPALVVDTRTQRAFDSGRVSLVDNNEMDNIRNKLLTLSQDNISSLILVSPAPVYGFTPVELMQLKSLNKSPEQSAKRDAECWIADEHQMTEFIKSMLLLPNLKDCYIFSGDVHYGFGRIQYVTRTGDGSSTRFWQFTSSSTSNKPVGIASAGLKLLHSFTKIGAKLPFFRDTSPYLIPKNHKNDFLTGQINLGLLRLNEDEVNEVNEVNEFMLLRPQPNGKWSDWRYDLRNPVRLND